ncbi:MAG: SRPBCC family protein [Verrucomicrobiota bacterium]
MNTHTIRLHRVLKATPELVYKAFLDPEALCRWLPPDGYLCNVFHLEAKVGGTFKMAFTQFNNGHSHSFGGEYLELVPNELLRYTDVFDDPNLSGTIEVTVKLKAVSCGTELSVTQAGVPSIIPEEACYLGWQESLQHLARLVEGGPPADAECP